jgi:hypothetical protein
MFYKPSNLKDFESLKDVTSGLETQIGKLDHIDIPES